MDETESNGLHFLAGKTIIIAGGGIAGPAFVASLRKLWDPKLSFPKITMYERDSPEAAAQRETYIVSVSGYDPAGGLVALKKMGLLDHVLGHAVAGLEGTGAFKIWNLDWSEKLCLRRKPLDGIPTCSIRISRGDLRRVLLAAARGGENDIIEWDSQCIAAEKLPNNRVSVKVVHTDGSTKLEECDFLIAADGANSKVRRHLRPNDGLVYSGAVLRGGVARFDGPLPKPLGEDWGFVMSGTGVTCFFSPVDEHSVVWALGHAEKPVEPLDRHSKEQVQAVLDRSMELGAPFQEPFSTIVKQTDPKTILYLNAQDKLPFAHENIEELPVIFVGDSNHALSPFAGFGANLALSDGWDLAEQLCKSASLASAMDEYDGISMPRAERFATNSRWAARTSHSTGIQYYLFWLTMVFRWFMGWIRGDMQSR